MLKRLVYLCKHGFGFFIFGILSFAFILLLPIIYIGSLGNFARYVYVNQVITHHAFRFVVWYTRVIGFIDIDLKSSSHQLSKVVICNHVTLFDIVAIFSFFPHCYTFVNRKFVRHPLLWPIVHSCGYIPIDPENPRDRMQAYMKAKELVAEGKTVVVFPEGKRSRDGNLLPFQNGAFALALDAGEDITPIFFTIDRGFLNNARVRCGWLDTVRLHLYVMPQISIVPSESENHRAKAIQLKKSSEQRYREWMASPLALAYNHK